MSKKKNGAVKISGEQAAMIAQLAAQKAEVEARLNIVLSTIAAGQGVTAYQGVHLDTDKNEVRFEPLEPA